MPDVAQAPRRPDPYVWQPDPYGARWRRWATRAKARRWTEHGLAPLASEPQYWQPQPVERASWHPPCPWERVSEQLAPFEDAGDLVRPYVAIDLGEEWQT